MQGSHVKGDGVIARLRFNPVDVIRFWGRNHALQIAVYLSQPAVSIAQAGKGVIVLFVLCLFGDLTAGAVNLIQQF